METENEVIKHIEWASYTSTVGNLDIWSLPKDTVCPRINNHMLPLLEKFVIVRKKSTVAYS